MKVFMTGATGFVGKKVLRALMEDGHEVRCLTRKESIDKYPDDISGDFSIIEGAISEPENLVKSMKGCDVVINLIGIIREFRYLDITFEKAHFETTKSLVDAAKKNGITRFVHMSSLGAKEGAKSKYHKTKFKAEEYIRNNGMKYTIFQPSIIFGCGDSFVSTLTKIIKISPIIPVIGTGEYRVQPVFVNIIAEAFSKSLTNDKTIGKVYEVGGPHKIQFKQVMDIIGKVIGKKVRTINQPVFFANILASVFEEIPFFPVSRDQITMTEEDNVCRDGEDSFNKEFKIPQVGFQEGLEKYLNA